MEINECFHKKPMQKVEKMCSVLNSCNSCLKIRVIKQKKTLAELIDRAV